MRGLGQACPPCTIAYGSQCVPCPHGTDLPECVGCAGERRQGWMERHPLGSSVLIGVLTASAVALIVPLVTGKLRKAS